MRSSTLVSRSLLGLSAVLSLVEAANPRLAQAANPRLRSRSLLGSNFGVPRNDTFDYVVIGGGTAGLTVAYRLAEANNLVAVVEGGSFYELGNGNISQIPADGVYFAGKDPSDTNPLIDWNFTTTPQAVGLRVQLREV